MPPVQLLTPQEAGRVLGVSPGWVLTLATRGQLPIAYQSGRVQLFDPQEVEALRAAREANPPKPGPSPSPDDPPDLYWLRKALRASEQALRWADKGLEGRTEATRRRTLGTLQLASDGLRRVIEARDK